MGLELKVLGFGHLKEISSEAGCKRGWPPRKLRGSCSRLPSAFGDAVQGLGFRV